MNQDRLTTIKIKEPIRRQFKARCAVLGRSMRSVLEEVLESWLERQGFGPTTGERFRVLMVFPELGGHEAMASDDLAAAWRAFESQALGGGHLLLVEVLAEVEGKSGLADDDPDGLPF